MSLVRAQVWAAESETEQGDESTVAVSEEVAAEPLEVENKDSVKSTDADDSEPVETEDRQQPPEALSTQAVANGACGKNLTWTLDESGTLTISGKGKMKVYDSFSDWPWHSYTSQIKTVVIQYGVTHVIL